MLLDWPRSFDQQLERLDAKVSAGDAYAGQVQALVEAQMRFLIDDVGKIPRRDSESKLLRWVRQSRRYPIWRVSHEFLPGIAVRTIVWFPSDGQAVILLLYSDKAHMGDLFYESVGERADRIISEYLREIEINELP